jgi:hypothetical protein
VRRKYVLQLAHLIAEKHRYGSKGVGNMRKLMHSLAWILTINPIAVLLFAQNPQPLNVLIGTQLASGLAIGINTSGGLTNWLAPEPPPPSPGDLKMVCPPAQAWCAMFITYGPALSTFPRPGIDLSGYQTLTVEIEGDSGTTIQVGIKDATQPDTGAETKVTLQVASNWTTFTIPLSSFTGANLKNIYVPCEFVFPGGPQAQTLRVRSIAFSSAPPVTTMVLPQFVFGGGWYSALYFTNTGGTQASFQVNFIADNGGPLFVPSAGGASVTVTLASRATSIIEAPNVGSLTDGYVSAALPNGIVGYGVFRQSVSGIPDQEAVVPLSNSSGTTSTLVWDETTFVTGVAIVNPSNAATTVSVTAYDSSGEIIGTSSVSLSAGSKTTAILKTLPGLSAMAGSRGSADFVVGSGNVAVLGLRFNGSAFTSIPTTSQ